MSRTFFEISPVSIQKRYIELVMLVKKAPHSKKLVIITGFLSFLIICFLILGVYILLNTPDDNDSTVLKEDINLVEESEEDSSTSYQQLVADLIEQLKDEEYAITLYHFSEPEKSFSINGDKVMTSASTYKLFTAYSMYETGQPPQCLEDMIVYSDNDCVDYWGGWNEVNDEAHAIGAINTDLVSMPATTTSNDLASFLVQLYNGTLLSNTDTNELLSYMKNQIYREGIPAGIPEAEIADKVGFIDAVFNDAGIVYSPKGDFVLVILTNGYSWDSIANMSSEIYASL